MTETAPCIALRARLVFPVSAPPIDGGVITLQGDRIVAVGENASSSPARDLGDVALLPGLVNPHTHLEFSGFSSPLGLPGMPLHQWIDAVVKQRRSDSDQQRGVLNVAGRAMAIEQGVRQCVAGGTTTVGDIATWDVSEDYTTRDGPHCCAFRELIGLPPTRVGQQLEAARQFLASPLPHSAHVSRGLSPHAPYTAAPELVQQVTVLSKQLQKSVAMHLAESSEELRLLAAGDGPFRDLLQRFEVWDAAAFPGGRRPMDYLQWLSQSHRSLVVHGNFLGPEDWQLLARHRDRMSVVYCPRTHDYFRHPDYPLLAMLRAGVRVVLGTDGRASNPDLNIFEELRFVARRHQNVAPHQLLKMITLDAAESLGVAEQVGSLECGKRADLAVVRVDLSAGDRDPHAALLGENAKVCGTWLRGSES